MRNTETYNTLQKPEILFLDDVGGKLGNWNFVLFGLCAGV